MEFQFVVDVSKFNKLIAQWGPTQYVKLRKNAVRASQKFISLIVKRWYTTRRGDVGLYSHSGSSGLRGSWFHKVEFNSSEGLVATIATNKEYARIHEKGGDIKFKSGRTITIPKRTFVHEDFEKEGLTMFINQLRTSFV